MTQYQVCWWDVRKGGNPEGVIGLDHSHLDPVYKTIWMNAKTGTEFFTGSTDGTVSRLTDSRLLSFSNSLYKTFDNFR